uniref:2-oxoglutarate dehydrogenase E1 subunit family protein n=1 Tax=Ferrimicrobium sp. TaxID=2926050 RepID=UPI00262F7EFC
MDIKSEPFGPNDWLVEEMYNQYLENPRSVSGEWREFFEGRSGIKAQSAESIAHFEVSLEQKKTDRNDAGTWKPMAPGGVRQVATEQT